MCIKPGFRDHGRNAAFQARYAKLNLSDLNWVLEERSAQELIAASMNNDFRQWFDCAGSRVTAFRQKGWSCIDNRADVQRYWERAHTWIVPPVLLSGKLVQSVSALHLVKGHTRVGLLAGLIKHDILPTRSIHAIWMGFR